ncbi:spore germination lipoprotein GerD [Ferroacidibacillus organovorans]|uniref:Spore germination GerD central core domain-containing protein n=1 Tax=Ferroacidibacillus organovorans TaxID=1765683 RepID=A0A162SAQ6_9BACL|nr:spore germination lipoprotein GerD [Ferroacidibacillus organovorans]KYP79662.1 hypothetical protein AYJ22_03655 [Ferroacidibacillus organovorans]OAG94837.1 hypothetical protein AYW79_03525 [Ferroacidibacillus organovorans]OPG17019.1 hypothetical protein B2M26_03715 [Ferroacidibacillus organovorans]
MKSATHAAHVWLLGLGLTATLAGCGLGGSTSAEVSNASPQSGSSAPQSGSSSPQGQDGQATGQGGTQGAAGKSGQASSGGTAYPDLKAMVLDILHSKEGMATLRDTMTSPEFKRLSVVTQADISTAVEKTLQQGKNKSLLTEQMKDPQFAAAVVNASKEQLTNVQKQLMTDPTYQKDLLALMKSPEYQKMQFDLLKSPEYRKEIMMIMTEALQLPTFRLLFQDSMKEAVKQAGGGDKEKMGKTEKPGASEKGEKGEKGKSDQEDTQKDKQSDSSSGEKEGSGSEGSSS